MGGMGGWRGREIQTTYVLCTMYAIYVRTQKPLSSLYWTVECLIRVCIPNRIEFYSDELKREKNHRTMYCKTL